MPESRDILLSTMDGGERELLAIQEQGLAEKRRMAELVWRYQTMAYAIDTAKHLARRAATYYNEDHDDDSLNDLEVWVEAIENFTWYRQQLREQIRESREKIRWLRQEYKETKTRQRS